MKKPTFLGHPKPLICSMVQANNPTRVLELMEKSRTLGADAFGMQLCKLKGEYRNEETYKSLFRAAGDKPTYITNYRHASNDGKSDEVLGEELVAIAKCGATLIDVMGDYFDKTEGELTKNPAAIEKQMKLIDSLHEVGAEVLMSSHVLKFTPAEKVLEIALAHQARGADISKIVVRAENMEQQIENLRIINLLKENLKIPFLFLSGGECRIIRRIGGEIGCCMYLTVAEHDELSTPAQPLLADIVKINEVFGK